MSQQVIKEEDGINETYENKWKNRIERIAKNKKYPFDSWFDSNGRLYIPFDQELEYRVPSSIEKELNDLGYYHIDHINGLCSRGERFIKISKLLNKNPNNNDLIKIFNNSRSGKVLKSEQLNIVFSQNVHDIAKMSTGRGWRSCLQLPLNDLKSGYEYKNLFKEVKNGGIVAYLIKKEDKEIDNPISRIWIRRFICGRNTILFPENKVYGYNSENFLNSVKNYLNNKQKNIKSNFYKYVGGDYSDTFDKKRYVFFSNNKEDIIKLYKNRNSYKKVSGICYSIGLVNSILEKGINNFDKSFIEEIIENIDHYYTKDIIIKAPSFSTKIYISKVLEDYSGFLCYNLIKKIENNKSAKNILDQSIDILISKIKNVKELKYIDYVFYQKAITNISSSLDFSIDKRDISYKDFDEKKIKTIIKLYCGMIRRLNEIKKMNIYSFEISISCSIFRMWKHFSHLFYSDYSMKKIISNLDKDKDSLSLGNFSTFLKNKKFHCFSSLLKNNLNRLKKQYSIIPQESLDSMSINFRIKDYKDILKMMVG